MADLAPSAYHYRRLICYDLHRLQVLWKVNKQCIKFTAGQRLSFQEIPVILNYQINQPDPWLCST
jgi:hypothetical protein